MGTNYYLHAKPKPPCLTCGHVVTSEPIHIGKSSAGWCFSLHVYPQDEYTPEDHKWLPRTLEEWKALFENERRYILNEYDDDVDTGEMLRIITERTWNGKSGDLSQHSERGPNGLTRHKAEPGHCLGPGPDDATYDLVIGSFS